MRKLQHGEGWKIHLSLPQTLEDPRTHAVVKLCAEKRWPFKFGTGGTGKEGELDTLLLTGEDVGKNMTIYAYSRASLDSVAAAIENIIINDQPIDLPFPADQIIETNMPLTKSGKIWGRFRTEDDKAFQDYGCLGLPYIDTDSTAIHADHKNRGDSMPLQVGAKFNRDALRRTYFALEETFGEVFTGAEPGTIPEWAEFIILQHSPKAIERFMQLFTQVTEARERTSDASKGDTSMDNIWNKSPRNQR